MKANYGISSLLWLGYSFSGLRAQRANPNKQSKEANES